MSLISAPWRANSPSGWEGANVRPHAHPRNRRRLRDMSQTFWCSSSRSFNSNTLDIPTQLFGTNDCVKLGVVLVQMFPNLINTSDCPGLNYSQMISAPVVKCHIKFICFHCVAQTMLWLSNSVLCNTLGMAVILRVHGHWSRLLCSPLLSSPVCAHSPRQPDIQAASSAAPQQQRNDPLCFTERRASFREGPPPHRQV